jgi:hypothetical protein
LGEGECTRLKAERERRLHVFSTNRGKTTLIPALLPSREKGSNGLHDGGCIVQNLLIAEAQDAVALARQPFVSQRIVQLGLGKIVPAAIQFDDEAAAQMHEVGDVSADRSLTPEADVRRAQSLPQHRL